MRFVGILALLFALVFGLLAFTSIMSVSQDTASASTGGLAELVALFPTVWMLIIGGVLVAAEWPLPRQYLGDWQGPGNLAASHQKEGEKT